MGAAEVAEQLGTSKAYAYRIICRLNTELLKKGHPSFKEESAESISKSATSQASL